MFVYMRYGNVMLPMTGVIMECYCFYICRLFGLNNMR